MRFVQALCASALCKRLSLTASSLTWMPEFNWNPGRLMRTAARISFRADSMKRVLLPHGKLCRQDHVVSGLMPAELMLPFYCLAETAEQRVWLAAQTS